MKQEAETDISCCCCAAIPESPDSKVSLPAGKEKEGWKRHWDLLLALTILAVLLILRYGFRLQPPELPLALINLAAFLLAGRNVLLLAFRKAERGDFFNEFTLMSVATLGAFLLREYEEGVAVMVFYQTGEWFQDTAVNHAKRNISALLDIRPDEVSVIRNGHAEVADPSGLAIGEIFRIRPGEKVALDGDLLSEHASFNTAALTGESRPDTKYKGDRVLAGMINLNTAAEVRVTSLFRDSKLSRILEMVRDATARKSQTQLFISRFARVYTPVVFFLALAVCLLPYFIVDDYSFHTWFYRALVFLVVSCPCALVVSIPLGYFGGIGLASRNGILFKGGSYLDQMTRINAVVMDKTGTLTKGVFKVQKAEPQGMETSELLRLAAALELHSTHPVGKALIEYAAGGAESLLAREVEEIAGHGLRGLIDGREVLAGNLRLLRKYGIGFPAELEQLADTLVVVAVEKQYAGYFTIADELKDDAREALKMMQDLGIKTILLSGDKQSVVDGVAKALHIGEAFGDLLPEEKAEKVQQLKDRGFRVAFAGDGVNDAPVIALSDVGIAMGGLGSDATIETADVVIQNDQPSKIVSAIRAGKITRNIVWQNIVMAMGVKVFVLFLAAGGIATLWEAVIADVGVALLAILNAVRIQHKRV